MSLLHALDAALAAHPSWPRCPARSPDRRDRAGWRAGYEGCGYPLDPALGSVDVHPWCERWYHPAVYARDTNQRAAEYTAVRRNEHQRIMLAARQGQGHGHG